MDVVVRNPDAHQETRNTSRVPTESRINRLIQCAHSSSFWQTTVAQLARHRLLPTTTEDMQLLLGGARAIERERARTRAREGEREVGEREKEREEERDTASGV